MSGAQSAQQGWDTPGRVAVESPWGRFARRFKRQRVGIVAVGFLALLSVLAVIAPMITPYDPNVQVLSDRLQDPNSTHWLGTDDLGRDSFSRMLVSTRVSLLAAFEAAVVSFVLGVPLGLVAGYLRGWTDVLLSRVAEVIMAIPGLLFAMAIVAILGRDIENAMIAIGVVNAPRFYRVVRASTLVVREQVFIAAAVSTGGSAPWILRHHVLPNVLSPLVVQLSLSMGFAILFEAALSFLGLGVQPPDASWGTMLGRSTQYMERAPFLVIFPGLAILLTVLAFNVLGDAVNDALGRQGEP
ncbi:MAG: ABC transporter permease [Chloroflexi bacterium]|nr:ABC transporter permease [Chloroflexota bacterium]